MAARTKPKSDAKTVLSALRSKSDRKTIAGMARYGIATKDDVWGVSVASLQQIAKQTGRDHALATALWKTGVYEARMLACFVDEPARVTPAQMDRWCRAFDNWALCDTACFHLFDRTPHAFDKVHQWAPAKSEFVKRTAFALIASLAGHDKTTADDRFLAFLPVIAAAADDERNFVKKGVSWALRGVGQRSTRLHAAAVKLATKLALSSSPTARWLGKDALRDLGRKAVLERLARKST